MTDTRRCDFCHAELSEKEYTAQLLDGRYGFLNSCRRCRLLGQAWSCRLQHLNDAWCAFWRKLLLSADYLLVDPIQFRPHAQTRVRPCYVCGATIANTELGLTTCAHCGAARSESPGRDAVYHGLSKVFGMAGVWWSLRLAGFGDRWMAARLRVEDESQAVASLADNERDQESAGQDQTDG